MQKADKMGRPWYGLVPTLVIGGGLAYLNVSYGKSTLRALLFTMYGTN